jgi:hypothetical protein
MGEETFEKIDRETGFIKEVTKHGTSLGINFTKEETRKYDLSHKDKVKFERIMKIKEDEKIKEERKILQDALAYWGDEKLHTLLDSWYNKLLDLQEKHKL